MWYRFHSTLSYLLMYGYSEDVDVLSKRKGKISRQLEVPEILTGDLESYVAPKRIIFDAIILSGR